MLPVANNVPPDGKLYQLNVPELATAEMVNESPLQIVAGVVEVTEGLALTVAITGVLTDVQLPFAAET